MKAAQDFELSDGKLIKKGDEVPESEIVRLFNYNREFLDLQYDEGLPVLSEADQKKLGDPSWKPKAKPFKITKKVTMEELTQKMNELGASEFKEWAEKKYGEKVVDKRKAGKNIIVDIINFERSDR